MSTFLFQVVLALEEKEFLRTNLKYFSAFLMCKMLLTQQRNTVSK